MAVKSEFKTLIWSIFVTVVGLGAAALFGYLFDIQLLKSFRHDWISMKIVTALCLVACAGALVAAQSHPDAARMRWLSQILGVCVGLAGLVSLFAYAWAFQSGQEPRWANALLIREFFSLPARMAPVTALIMVGFGSAFVFLGSSSPRGPVIAQAIALTVGLASHLVLVSYAFDANELHAWGGVPVAVNTGLACGALSIGLFFVRSDTRFMKVWLSAGVGGMMARRLLPTVIAVPILIGWLRFMGERAGLIAGPFGATLAIAANGVVLLWVMWLTARAANLTDERRRHTEAALRESEERYRSLVEMSPDAVFVNRDNRIVAVNRAALRLLAADTPDQVVGRSPFDIFHPDSHSTVRERIEKVLAGQTVPLIEEKIVRLDGATCDVEVAASQFGDQQGTALQVILRDITERKLAEEALRQSEQRVRLKLDSILSPKGDIGNLDLQDIIDVPAIQSLMDDFHKLSGVPMAIIDLKGTVLVGVGWQDICTRFHRRHPEASRHCLESDTQLTAGIAPGEFRLYKCKNNMWDVATPLTLGGRHVGNLFTGQFFLQDEPPDFGLFRSQAKQYGFDEKEYLSALEKVPRLSRESVSTGMAFLVKLGHLISLLSYSNIKLARSLSERDALTDSLKASGEILSRAQEIAHVGSWELDLVEDRLSWSDEVYRIFGLEPQEFGATYEAFLESIHPDDRAAVNSAYSDSLKEGKPTYEIEHRVVRRDTGDVRWVHEKCEHFRDTAGNVIRSLGMVQDITERKHAEELLRQSQKLESIGLLAGGIAHDFNNLLVGIIGNASLAEDMLPSTSPVLENLRSIVKSGEQASHLTRQMLAYAGKGRSVVEAINLSELAGEASSLIQSSISKKIAFRLQLEPKLPAVESDPSQMQQIIMNLVLNAAEAIGSDAGVISVKTGEVNTDAADIRESVAQGWSVEPGRHVFLEVQDTGCGMNEATKAKIFDPFFTTKFQGRGLGLAAVAGIVRAQKGAIQVTTAPGAGATFRVLLPAAAESTVVSAPSSRGAEDLQGKGTVLVVDDEEVVRDVVQHGLKRHGYEVLAAASGPAAVDILRSHGDRIRLVVLDLGMPGMSGEETLPHLREIKPDLEVIVSSGYAEAEALRPFSGTYVSGFIQKPYTVQELARRVKSVLGIKRAAACLPVGSPVTHD